MRCVLSDSQTTAAAAASFPSLQRLARQCREGGWGCVVQKSFKQVMPGITCICSVLSGSDGREGVGASVVRKLHSLLGVISEGEDVLCSLQGFLCQ